MRMLLWVRPQIGIVISNFFCCFIDSTISERGPPVQPWCGRAEGLDVWERGCSGLRGAGTRPAVYPHSAETTWGPGGLETTTQTLAMSLWNVLTIVKISVFKSHHTEVVLNHCCLYQWDRLFYDFNVWIPLFNCLLFSERLSANIWGAEKDKRGGWISEQTSVSIRTLCGSEAPGSGLLLVPSPGQGLAAPCQTRSSPASPEILLSVDRTHVCSQNHHLSAVNRLYIVFLKFGPHSFLWPMCRSDILLLS